MNKIGGAWREASIKGTWHKEGWGYVKHGLRGLVLEKDGEDIQGYVFSSTNLDNHWQTLDEFEGRDYERVEATAHCSGGETEKAFVYALKR